MNKKDTKHTDIIAFQHTLRPAPPKEKGPKEYRDYRDTLIEMDRILGSGIEHDFVLQKMGDYLGLSSRKAQREHNRIRTALRFAILLALTGDSSRELAIRVSDSRLLQWFTSFDIKVKGTSKSAIDRHEKRFSDTEITELIHILNQAVGNADLARRLILESELDFSRHWVDSTCIKADIHFPVDWILLRDAARSLIGSIEVIRKHGLKHRIGDPQDLIRKMNSLVMQMTHTRKKKNGSMLRKKILRKMNRLMKTIESHGHRYHELLVNHWQTSDLTSNEVQIVLKHLETILYQVPDAIEQARKRIIKGEKVDNSQKILSLYEKDVHVLIRGKSGAAVEFGNGLYLAENEDGLITDWQFLEDQPPADSSLVTDSLKRLNDHYGTICSFTGDRGFHSSANSRRLEKDGIYNAICPKSVPEMENRLCEGDFVRLQKRRAGTEARISILKNNYIGKTLRSKGFKHRKRRVGLSILTHNLWLLASIAAENRRAEEELFQQTG